MANTTADSLAVLDGEAASMLPGPADESEVFSRGDAVELPARDDRFRGIRDIRRHLARGMLVNGVFQVGLLAVAAIRGVAVAAFITRSDYGLWGLIGLTIWTALGLKNQFGAGEKYIQQSEADQELAFQRAFTMEVLFTAAVLPIAAGVVVAVAVASGRSEVLLPGFLLLLLLPATMLQFPLATFYRRLDFRRQRTLQAANPIVAIVVTVGLAAAGAGYWSFVVGTLAGAWAQALVALRVCPYPLALRYQRGTLRQYALFSSPLLVTALAVLAEFYVIYLVGNAVLGVAALGAFTLTGNLVQFTDQADSIVTETLYPAVCAVKNRVTLLSEIFVKSNRLSLVWAVPFGVGMALFASDLVRLILGPRSATGRVCARDHGGGHRRPPCRVQLGCVCEGARNDVADRRVSAHRVGRGYRVQRSAHVPLSPRRAWVGFRTRRAGRVHGSRYLAHPILHGCFDPHAASPVVCSHGHRGNTHPRTACAGRN